MERHLIERVHEDGTTFKRAEGLFGSGRGGVAIQAEGAVQAAAEVVGGGLVGSKASLYL